MITLHLASNSSWILNGINMRLTRERAFSHFIWPLHYFFKAHIKKIKQRKKKKEQTFKRKLNHESGFNRVNHCLTVIWYGKLKQCEHNTTTEHGSCQGEEDLNSYQVTTRTCKANANESSLYECTRVQRIWRVLHCRQIYRTFSYLNLMHEILNSQFVICF